MNTNKTHTSLITDVRPLVSALRSALHPARSGAFIGMAMLAGLASESGQAAIIKVNDSCTLIDAISSANTDTATNGCSAGKGTDTIVLPSHSVQVLTTINNTSLATASQQPSPSRMLDNRLISSNTDTISQSPQPVSASITGSSGLPVISSVITISGNGSTIKRDDAAPSSFRIFSVSSTGNLTLNNTKVTGGIAAGDKITGKGGAILIDTGGKVTLNQSSLSGNKADYFGGAVYTMGGLTINNSTISGNSAGHTSGAVENYGLLVINNSTISGNTAGDSCGATVNAPPGTALISNSTISSNTATNYGGGFCNYKGASVLDNSTISGNIAGNGGGGIDNFKGNTFINDSTISGNTATNAGGGIEIGVQSTVVLTRSMVSGNSSPSGQEVFNFRQKVCYYKYCYYYSGALVASNHNVFGHSSDPGIFNASPGATDLIPTQNARALLGSLQDNGGSTKTHALPRGSQAISAGVAGPQDILRLGTANFGGQFLKGMVDEISIYKDNLTATQIKAIYQAGSAGKCLPNRPANCVKPATSIIHWWPGEDNAEDVSGAMNGKLEGNAAFGAGIVGKAFNFDGTNSDVLLGKNASVNFGMGDFTIEFWVKRLGTSTLESVIDYGDGGTWPGIKYAVILNNLHLEAQIANALNPNAPDIVLTSSDIFSDQNWHHGAVLRNGNLWSLYVDGALQSSVTRPGIIPVTGCQLQDQRGITRPQGTKCDSGSVEATFCETVLPTKGCTVNGAPNRVCKGTPGVDTISGTSGNDVIIGLGGNDKIQGLGGDDKLCGGLGADNMSGGDGLDQIFGGFGADILSGDNDNDILNGEQDNDSLDGGTGADKLDGGPGTKDKCTADDLDTNILNCEL